MVELSMRALEYEDYDELLVSWWKQWGWTPPPRDFLPKNGAGGLIVYYESIPVVAGFMYTTNSGIAWIEFIVSNKEFRLKPYRQQAIELLIDTLTKIAKNIGHKYGYAILKNKNLIDTYESLGYTKGDISSQEMIKHI